MTACSYLIKKYSRKLNGVKMIENFLILSFLMITLLAAIFVIPGLMMRRAAFKVIKTFCEYDALEAGKARERGELGLNPPDFLGRLFKARDYKPQALQFLNQAGVVRSTEDGRLYMVEEKLDDELKCKEKQPQLHA